MTRTPLYAILAAGLLALGAFAAPVLAQGDSEDQDEAKDRREAARERAEAAREAAKERREAAQERYQDHCVDDADELNETQQERCMKFKEFADRAHKARREGHALLGAVSAMERRIGRLEVREEMLEQKLAAGNFSDNETAESIQAQIDKIEEHQERIMERLAHLKERLETLHDKWKAVREHVEERRHGAHDEDDEGEDDEDVDDEEQTTSSTSSSSAAA